MRFGTSEGRGQSFVPRTNVRPTARTSGPASVAPIITEDEAAKEFSAVVLEFSRGDLAQLSGRTKEAAKHWKAGTRAPNSSSLITMARRNSRIKEWVIAQMDADVPGGGDDAKAELEMRAQLQMTAQMPGQEGAMARAMLKILERGQ